LRDPSDLFVPYLLFEIEIHELILVQKADVLIYRDRIEIFHQSFHLLPKIKNNGFPQFFLSEN
jgi:hypothetical protein